MTNINCASDCKHQTNGKCSLDNITTASVSFQNECAYYEKQEKKK